MTKKTSSSKPHGHSKASGGSKKHVGDVLGISRARVPDHVPRATKDRGGNPKGIEVGGRRSSHLKPSRTVGGVRAHRTR
jgi:hypothetical protein